MFGWTKKTRCQIVRGLAPLRVSDDLSADEAELVDRHVQRCPSCRAELDSFERTRSVLANARAASAMVSSRGCDGALWARLEPRLGPVGKFRRQRMPWIATSQLAAACLGMFGFTMYNETVARPRAATLASKSPALGAKVPVGRGVNVGLVGDMLAGDQPKSLNGAGLVVGDSHPQDIVESAFVSSLGMVLAAAPCDVDRLDGRICGPVVSGIVRGWPASRGDIREGDIIVAVDDRAVFSPVEVECAIRGCGGRSMQSEGRQTTLRLVRRGVPFTVTIVWHDVPSSSEQVPSETQSPARSMRRSFDRLGIRHVEPQ